MGQFEESKERFEQLLPELLKEHRGKTLAVVGQEYHIDEDEERLFDFLIEKYGDVEMCVGPILPFEEWPVVQCPENPIENQNK